MIKFTLHRRTLNDGSVLAFDVNPSIHNTVWDFVKRQGAKSNDHFEVTIEAPFEPRTVGFRKQSGRFNGHCQDIREWWASQGKEYSLQEIRDAMKRMAVQDGYPTHMAIDGTEVCNSEASLSKNQMGILIRRQQLYADALDIPLTEYSEEKCEECGGYKVAQHSDDCAAGLGQPCDCGAEGKKCPRCRGAGIVLVPYKSLHGRTRAEMIALEKGSS